jgi:hypothetical protein
MQKITRHPSAGALSVALGLVATVALLVAPSSLQAQGWTSWTSGTGVVGGAGSLDGTLFGSAVNWSGTTYGGQYSDGSTFGGPVTQNGGGNNYFVPSGAYTQNGLTAPGLGFVQLNSGGSGTITFSTPVINPYLAFISTGRTSLPVTFYFGDSFTVLSHNTATCAYWGCGSYAVNTNDLTGYEFSGTIQFQGTFSSLTFRFDPAEDWHGLTVGADGVVPEPATMSLLATGLVGMAAARRRRRKG